MPVLQLVHHMKEPGIQHHTNGKVNKSIVAEEDAQSIVLRDVQAALILCLLQNAPALQKLAPSDEPPELHPKLLKLLHALHLLVRSKEKLSEMGPQGVAMAGVRAESHESFVEKVVYRCWQTEIQLLLKLGFGLTGKGLLRTVKPPDAAVVR